MASSLLAGLRVVTTAANLPGPAACARLRDLGATVDKVEPPAGDPFESYCPAWYALLHADVTVHRLDLKAPEGQVSLGALLEQADLLITAQRPAALSRMGMSARDLAERFPRLCHVAITGHAPPQADLAGHDLTYGAEAGLLSPPALPATLYSDLCGAERAVSTALALVIARDRGRPARAAHAPLADAAQWLALPRTHGLTTPGGLLGGGLPGYNLYAAKNGWIALAALEPHFERRLSDALALSPLTTPALAARFATETREHWEHWARSNDIPLSGVN